MEYIENILRYGKKMMSSSWSTDVLNFLLDGIKKWLFVQWLMQVLCNIQVFAKATPSLFAPHYQDLFIHSADSYQIKALKLEILSYIATDSSVSFILKEFQVFHINISSPLPGEILSFLATISCILKEFWVFHIKYIWCEVYISPHSDSPSFPSPWILITPFRNESDTSLYNQLIQESEKWRKHSFIKHNELSLLNLSYRKEETI